LQVDLATMTANVAQVFIAAGSCSRCGTKGIDELRGRVRQLGRRTSASDTTVATVAGNG